MGEAVKLNTPRKDGTTLRQHLESVEASTGSVQFEEPEPPEDGEYLWGWFWELDAGRGGGGFGLNPLSFQEIAAWAGLTGNELEPWEIKVLKRMDAARLKATDEVK